MKILGLSFGYHDSAAAIIVDGDVLAACAEERFTRIKHDEAFPIESIKFCLDFAKIDINSIDAIVYYENPISKFDRIIKSSFYSPSKGIPYLFDTFRDWVANKKFFVKKEIMDLLGVSEEKIHFCSHHLSHAASAYYTSRFSDAIVVAIDGVGEHESVAVYIGRGNSLKKLYSINFPNSLGLFYSSITAYLGFEVNEGEYKVMGMSGFGQPKYYNELMSMFKLKGDGTFTLNQRCFEFLVPVDKPYNDNLIAMFGAHREPGSVFNIKETESQKYADIAASAQKCAEEVILHIVGSAIKKTGLMNVCMAGGVALNSLANGRLAKELDINIFIQPAAGDGGCAVGCALDYYYKNTKAEKNIKSIFNAYLGKQYGDNIILQDIKNSRLKYNYFDDEDALIECVATALNNGGVVGWFQGRSEWGPRALGHRSILANPTRKDMQEIVNEKVKFREPFRPFAPIVIAQEAGEYFELPAKCSEDSPECFMLSVHKVKRNKQAIIPAVTHIDETARVQILYEHVNPRMYRLLKKFKQKSGVPILMNTSFNLKDEPVVESPKDALKTFFYAGMDLLVLENYIVTKEYKL